MTSSYGMLPHQQVGGFAVIDMQVGTTPGERQGRYPKNSRMNGSRIRRESMANPHALGLMQETP